MGEDLLTIVGPDGTKHTATRKAWEVSLRDQGYTLDEPKPSRPAKPKAETPKKA